MGLGSGTAHASFSFSRELESDPSFEEPFKESLRRWIRKCERALEFWELEEAVCVEEDIAEPDVEESMVEEDEEIFPYNEFELTLDIEDDEGAIEFDPEAEKSVDGRVI